MSDTGPLNYLIQLDAVSRVELLFGTLLIPHAVWRELRSESSPTSVRQWVEELPAWCRVVELDAEFRAGGSHAGEREVVLLSMQVGRALC